MDGGLPALYGRFPFDYTSDPGLTYLLSLRVIVAPRTYFSFLLTDPGLGIQG